MRIYDLAKFIGRNCGIQVKSSDLANEFKALPEFAEIHDTIKSHSSSVDDKYAKTMIEIYAKRHGKEPASVVDLSDSTDSGKDEAPAAAKSAAPKAVKPKPTTAAAPPPPKPRPTPHPKPVAGGPPRPLPIRPSQAVGGPRPVAPIPVVRRPEPIPSAPMPTVQQEMQPTPAAEGTPPGKSPGVHAVSPKVTRPRPSGLASELKSSTGTTGVTADPTAGRGAGVDAAGQPTSPAMPKFSSESVFMRALRGEPTRPARETRRPGETRDTRGEGAGVRRGVPRVAGEPEGPAPLPEIGVMKLKGKRHRPAPVDKPGTRRGGKEAGPASADDAGKGGKKTFRPSKVYSDPEQFRRPPTKPGGRPRKSSQKVKEETPKVVGPVIITGPLTTAEFAEKMGIAAGELIKNAFLKGKAITINQLIDLEFAEEIAIDMDIDLRVQLEGDETDIAHFLEEADREEDYRPRPPVVTIMGHVDHGKTSVLDFFRKSRIAEGEFGGITQHIGAYKVPTHHGDIVFLDTPGHEAFTAMRARGVRCTDIAVLVVAADDGVMPQTVESINHARAAAVPLIVAINKMDLPQASADRVRKELMQHQVLAAQLGGDVEFVEISAKKGMNMDNLLEVVSLQSQLLELKSNPKRRAKSIVIESHVDPQRGAVATVLVQQGTLRVGDYFVVGAQSGRVRSMVDDLGLTIKEACLAMPVELIGLSGTPEVGEILLQMDNEREAREIAERRGQRRRLMELGTTRHVTLEGLHEQISQGEIKDLNVVLRADVAGSIEAITQAFDKLAADVIRIRVLHCGTGPVTESDVSLAMASDAVIIGFNVRPEPGAADLAQREGVEIKSYRIIYELLDEIERAMLGLVDRKFSEQTTGRAEIREIFKVTKFGTVAGCMVLDGEISRNAKARLVRDGTVVYEGALSSLRRVKDDVSKVAAGYECGIALERYSDYKTGDVIETFVLEEIPVELVRTAQS
jgi:translation initiation factor IF-2